MKQIAIEIGVALVPALSALLLALIAYGTAFLRGKVKNEAAREAIDRADDELHALVMEQAQVLKQADKNSDGKTDLGELKEAKAQVIKNFKSLYGRKGLAKLVKISGIENDKLDSWLGSKVERHVRADKLSLKLMEPEL